MTHQPLCSLREMSLLSPDDLLIMSSLDNESFSGSTLSITVIIIIPVSNVSSFSIGAAGGYYSQLDGYASDEDDIIRFLFSNITNVQYMI